MCRRSAHHGAQSRLHAIAEWGKAKRRANSGVWNAVSPTLNHVLARARTAYWFNRGVTDSGVRGDRHGWPRDRRPDTTHAVYHMFKSICAPRPSCWRMNPPHSGVPLPSKPRSLSNRYARSILYSKPAEVGNIVLEGVIKQCLGAPTRSRDIGDLRIGVHKRRLHLRMMSCEVRAPRDRPHPAVILD